APMPWPSARTAPVWAASPRSPPRCSTISSTPISSPSARAAVGFSTSRRPSNPPWPEQPAPPEDDQSGMRRRKPATEDKTEKRATNLSVCICLHLWIISHFPHLHPSDVIWRFLHFHPSVAQSAICGSNRDCFVADRCGAIGQEEEGHREDDVDEKQHHPLQPVRFAILGDHSGDQYAHD